MKLNISYPANGTQKLVEIEDERKLRGFMEKRMGQEVVGDGVAPEFKGYVFKITGGNDKQGFPMKQGIMHPTRVRLLLGAGHSCYRPRRTGERKRKSVRGCIVAMDLSVLALSVMKQGDEEIPGLTDKVLPKRLGPKRSTKIRKFFGLGKDDDVSAALSLSCQPVHTAGYYATFFGRETMDTDDSRLLLGPQIRHPPRSSTKGRRQKNLHQGTPYPASCHSPASPTQASPNGSQASPGRILQGCCGMSTLLYIEIGTSGLVGCKANLSWQNEYASILAKRVNEEKAKKTELRSKFPLHLPLGIVQELI